ncbi:hypothetical protein MCBG_00500 [Micromonospora sp. M42]|nr:hypothetical protein MCBG_00500 [Micromonospora sp. M42]
MVLAVPVGPTAPGDPVRSGIRAALVLSGAPAKPIGSVTNRFAGSPADAPSSHDRDGLSERDRAPGVGVEGAAPLTSHPALVAPGDRAPRPGSEFPLPEIPVPLPRSSGRSW